MSGKTPHSNEHEAMRTDAITVPVISCTAADTVSVARATITGAVKLSDITMLIRHIRSIASLSISRFKCPPPFGKAK